MEEFFFTGQRKIVRKKLMWAIVWSLSIGLFIGVWVGQYWRMRQTEPEHQKEIAVLQERIENYQKNWVPIRPAKESKDEKVKGKD